MRYIKSQASLRQKPKRRISLGKNKRRVVRSSAEALSLRYNNPYKTFNRKPLDLGWTKHLILPGILLTWIGLLLYLPFFRVNNLSITGLKILTTGELQTAVDGIIDTSKGPFPSNNYFLVNEQTLASALQTKFSLNSVTITKVFPNRLNIAVEEKVSSAIYDNGTNYYLIDQNGSVLKDIGPVISQAAITAPSTTPSSTVTIEAVVASAPTPTFTPIIFTSTTAPAFATLTNTDTLNLDFGTATLTDLPINNQIEKQYSDYPIIIDLSEPAVSDNQSVLTPQIVAGAIDFYNKAKAGEHITVSHFLIDDQNAGLLAITNKKWQVKFDPTSDIDDQINNLVTVMRANQPTDYIDVRYGDRVYWK